MIIAEYDEKDLWIRSNKHWRTPNRDRPRLKLIGVAA